MTSDKKVLSFPLRCFKGVYEFLRPVLNIVVVVCAFLCCLRPKAGSNARLNSALILGVCAALLLAMKIFHKWQMRKDVYRVYRAPAARGLEPRQMVPLCFTTLIFMIPFYMVFITAFKNSGWLGSRSQTC